MRTLFQGSMATNSSDREDSVTGMLHISARLSVDSSVMTNSMKRQAASLSAQSRPMKSMLQPEKVASVPLFGGSAMPTLPAYSLPSAIMPVSATLLMSVMAA